MSTDQENVVIGRTVSDYAATKKRRVALQLEAKRIGEQLKVISWNLTNTSSFPDLDEKLPEMATAEEIKNLTSEIKEACCREDELKIAIKDFGLDGLCP